jgi:hypothetical protein
MTATFRTRARPRVNRDKKHCREGHIPKDMNGEPLVDLPTDAIPGTEAKIQKLIERRLAGKALFHKDDAQLPEGAHQGFFGRATFWNVHLEALVTETHRGSYEDMQPHCQLQRGR